MPRFLVVFLVLLSHLHGWGAPFEIVLRPPIVDDYSPADRSRLNRSSVKIPPNHLPAATALPRIPWLEKEGDFWTGRDPLIDLAEFRSGNRTMGWLALTDEHFLIHVEVIDQHHENDLEGKEIRKGDSLWVLFDAWGDDNHDRPYVHARSRTDWDPFLFGRWLPPSNDQSKTDWNALYVAALAKGQSASQRILTDDRGTEEALLNSIATVTRKEQVTSYDLQIPWKDFGTTPGTILHSALSIRSFDPRSPAPAFNPGAQWGGGSLAKDKRHLNGIFDEQSLSTLQRVLFEPPSQPRAFAHVSSRHLWSEDDHGEIVVTTNTKGPLFAEITVGSETKGHLLADEKPDIGWRRYGVLALPKLKADSKPIPFKVVLFHEGREIASAETTLVPAYQIHEELDRTIKKLEGQFKDSALSNSHYLSLLESDRYERQRRKDRDKRDLALLLRPSPLVEATTKGVLAIAKDPTWETILSPRGPLILAASNPDHTAGGMAEIWLPRGYDPRNSYPAYLWCNHDLRFEYQFQRPSPVGGYPEALGEQSTPTKSPKPSNSDAVQVIDHHQADGFIIVPRVDWNNSSSGLRNMILLLDHLLASESPLPIDRNRVHLWGGGKGGAIARTTAAALPDKFASLVTVLDTTPVNTFPGEPWDTWSEAGEPTWFALAGSDAVRNRCYLPSYFVLHPKTNSKAIHWRETLFHPRSVQPATNPRPVITVYPWDPKSPFQDIVPLSVGEDAHNWRVKQKRTRPSKFSYLKIHDLPIATWGIQMERDTHWHAFKANTWPRYEVRIEGQTVHLTTTNCEHCHIHLGAGGLDMKGEVTLHWNGKQVHQGAVPKTSIKLK